MLHSTTKFMTQFCMKCLRVRLNAYLHTCTIVDKLFISQIHISKKNHSRYAEPPRHDAAVLQSVVGVLRKTQQ